ncbi:hypothetical protein DWF00_12220 [Bosea caraganae]|uniref:Uncharacterized protein n=1 Tax=Bosea caraganae TaxID=2763117 RepID=A0A370LCQ2_9HYPH|nr:hypothetical protein DWF00_12220 [Bosea caraganae]RDJ29701.1 hypothetical protein DWE98_03990 [Bosea caraganae]
MTGQSLPCWSRHDGSRDQFVALGRKQRIGNLWIAPRAKSLGNGPVVPTTRQRLAVRPFQFPRQALKPQMRPGIVKAATGAGPVRYDHMSVQRSASGCPWLVMQDDDVRMGRRVAAQFPYDRCCGHYEIIWRPFR